MKDLEEIPAVDDPTSHGLRRLEPKGGGGRNTQNGLLDYGDKVKIKHLNMQKVDFFSDREILSLMCFFT